MRYLLFIISCVMLCCSCSDDDQKNTPTNPDTPTPPAQRTVIVYMSAENDLSGICTSDINEILNGRKLVAANENLVLFVDKASMNEKPFIAKVTMNNKLDTLYRYEQDFYSSDPDYMASVIKRAVELCPATEDYGLVLWGHANGWIVEQDSIATNRAYGRDTGNNTPDPSKGKWLNMPSMRQALESVGIHWKFIFCDCCNMMNVEVAYELRGLTDYLIGSPAEIPGNGAPYDTVVRDLFLRTENFYENIVDDYASAYPNRIPLSVIKADEEQMKTLADATRQVLQQVNNFVQTSNLQGYIYYSSVSSKTNSSQRYRIMFDMQEIVREALANDTEAYNIWYETFNQTVVYSKFATTWMTNGSVTHSDFIMKEENYGGVSMFIPHEMYAQAAVNHNEEIRKLAWYHAVGWSTVGW